MKRTFTFEVTVSYPKGWEPTVRPAKYTKADLEAAIGDYQQEQDGRNGFCHARVKVALQPHAASFDHGDSKCMICLQPLTDKVHGRNSEAHLDALFDAYP